MLTIFSVPKAFKGHIGLIQRNAIRSWSLLHPACEIVLCGSEMGTEEVSDEFQTKWLPNVTTTEYGTPLLNSVFDQVQRMAKYGLMCYVNADIILMSDLVGAVKRIRFRRFLAVGQRWNIDLTREWDFEQPDWEERLKKHVVQHGVLHPPLGSDFFVFPRNGSLSELPGFSVGRAGWDNWVIFRALNLGLAVVDITGGATVVHQNHGYSHVTERTGHKTEGPEADWNVELAGPAAHIFSSADATHVMTRRAILPAFGYKYLKRRLVTLPILLPDTRPLGRAIRLVTDFVKCAAQAII